MITFRELTFTLFTFISSSKRIIQSEKYKNRFHSERPYNSESESENAVPKGENLIQGSLICLTRLNVSKVLFIS
jgi:hypothetical protein